MCSGGGSRGCCGRNGGMFNIQQLVDGVAGLVLCGGGALGCCGRNGLVDGVAGLVLLLGVGWLVRRRLAVIACLKLRDLLARFLANPAHWFKAAAHFLMCTY